MSAGVRAAALAALFVVMSVPVAVAAPPDPFGHPCLPTAGVRFCPTVDLAQRVPAFDGVPLDVDVTLPPAGDGPFPAVVLLHGYSQSKETFLALNADGTPRPGSAGLDNVALAQRGYLVVNPSARGFGRSCGAPSSRTAGCERGWIHLADQRYEVRDVQDLLGRLVDQGLVAPDRIGASGISYGGGQSLALAFLRDRIREPEGFYRPWTSPRGTPLRLAVAAPVIPWADLASALLPNGRFRDGRAPGTTESRDPVGVPIRSFIDLLYNAGAATGFVAPAGADPGADLAAWRTRTAQGEPLGADVDRILDELYTFHGALAIPGTPAPLRISNGWTDDLFPVSQALRVYDRIRAANRTAPITLGFADFGHPRGTNKPTTTAAEARANIAFLDAYLRGVGTRPRPGSVTALLQTCPASRPDAGPVAAASWTALHPGALSTRVDGRQLVTSPGGDPQLGREFDPVSGAASCKTVRTARSRDTASVRVRHRRAFTYLGRATVAARIRTSGSAYGQLAARLWEERGGRQRLIDRGVYRLTRNQRGDVRFQLNGNGYRFAAGTGVRLELLGSDAPYFQRTKGAFRVRVEDLSVTLPTRERRPG